MAENYFIDETGRVRVTLTIRDTAYALRTSNENVRSLINLGLLESLGLASEVVPLSELNRFASEHLGEDLKSMIDDEQRSRKLQKQLRSVGS